MFIQVKDNKIIGVTTAEISSKDSTVFFIEEAGFESIGKQYTIEKGIHDKELTENEVLEKKIREAKAYLASTDFKMTADYDQDTTEVIVKRKKARELIRSYEDK